MRRGLPLDVFDLNGDVEAAAGKIQGLAEFALGHERQRDVPECKRLARAPADFASDLDSLQSISDSAGDGVGRQYSIGMHRAGPDRQACEARNQARPVVELRKN